MKSVFLISKNGMGQADPAHRILVLYEFLKDSLEQNRLPSHIVLLTEGVKLSATTGGVMDCLRSMEEQGVSIWVSAPCIAHYSITESQFVGLSKPLNEINHLLLRSERVIHL